MTVSAGAAHSQVGFLRTLVVRKPVGLHLVGSVDERRGVVDAHDSREPHLGELEGRPPDSTPDVEGRGGGALACKVLQRRAVPLREDRAALWEVDSALQAWARSVVCGVVTGACM